MRKQNEPYLSCSGKGSAAYQCHRQAHVYPCRLVGVSDLCDYPPEAAFKTKVSHSCINSAEMTSAEVVALNMQSLPS